MEYLKAHRARHFLTRGIDVITARYCNPRYLVEQTLRQPFGTANIKDVLKLLKPWLNSTHLVSYINAVTPFCFLHFLGCSYTYEHSLYIYI